jgi:hypothetical protein
MTSEIAIMNKEAIALASDSAVTAVSESGEKIFTSVNKLFALSKYHPVGIMIYGNATFMGVPWETIIKVYRNKLGKKSFNTLEEYAMDFISFLDNGNPMFPDFVQEEYLRNYIYGYFEFIRSKIVEKVHSIIDEEGEILDEVVEKIVSETIEEHYEKWEKADSIPTIPEDFSENIIKKYIKIIDKAIEDIFEELPISEIHYNQLRKISGNLFSKFPEGIGNENTSGIVVAGFGEEDIFPSLISFHIDGIIENRLKHKKHISAKIDYETDALIVPFAQREMVDTFMQGVDPLYIVVEEDYLSQIFKEYAEIVIEDLDKYTEEEKIRLKNKLLDIGNKILKDLKERLEEFRHETYISPITSVVSMLPKDELAAMAESLVNLTSLKRKFSMESETVGGPIDVAVISKGDGFIWIKRKYYFKAELNPQFFANYYKEGQK